MTNFFKTAVSAVYNKIENIAELIFSAGNELPPSEKTFFNLDYFNKEVWQGFFFEDLTEIQDRLASNKISEKYLRNKLLELQGSIGKYTLSPIIFQQGLKSLKSAAKISCDAPEKYLNCIDEVFKVFIANFNAEPAFIIECLEGEFIQLQYQIENSGLSFEEMESFLETVQAYKEYLPPIIYQQTLHYYKEILKDAEHKGQIRCSKELVDSAHGLIDKELQIAEKASKESYPLNESSTDWIRRANKQNLNQAKNDEIPTYKCENGLSSLFHKCLQYAAENPLQTAALIMVTQATAAAALNPLMQRQNKHASRSISSGNVDLAILNSTQGFPIWGAEAGDNSGSAVGSIVGFSGVNQTVLLIGSPNASPSVMSKAGVCAVVYANNSNITYIDLNALPASQGFLISGPAAGAKLGSSANFAGDVNNDGIPDGIVAAINASYAFYGKIGGYSSINLSTWTTAQGFAIDDNNVANNIGNSVGPAGDFNGDKIDDVIMGSATANEPFVGQTGVSWVVYGAKGGYSSAIDVNGLALGSDGINIYGSEIGDQLGIAVNTVGNFSGNSLSGIVTCAPNGSPNNRNQAGYCAVIPGAAGSSAIYLSTLSKAQGFFINGTQAGDHLGMSVAPAGNWNGWSTIAIGAPYGSPNGRYEAGYCVVVFNSNGGSGIDLATLIQTQGFFIYGGTSLDHLGSSVAAGDVNGDGKPDVVVCAPNASPNGRSLSGYCAVIFNKNGNYVSAVDLAALSQEQGFIINGAAASDNLGTAVAVTDVNNDELSDIIVGANNASPQGRTNAGATYVLYGSYTPCGLVNNTATITEGGNFTLSSANFGAIDYFYGSTDNQILFYVTNPVGVRFEFVNNGTPTTTFSQQQINDGSVRLVQVMTEIPETPSYDVSVSNIKTASAPQPALITYINLYDYPIQVLQAVSDITLQIGGTLNVFMNGYNYFRDPDNQPLTFTFQSSDGNPLPSWIMYSEDSNSTLRLYSNPVSKTLAGITEGLLFKATKIPEPGVVISNFTNFNITVVSSSSGNNTSVLSKNLIGVIAGSAVGGVAGLAALAAGAYGIFRYRQSKKWAETRKDNRLADLVRAELNLKGVDDFGSEKGIAYIDAITSVKQQLPLYGVAAESLENQFDMPDLAKRIAAAIKEVLTIKPAFFGNVLDPAEIQNKASIIAQKTATNFAPSKASDVPMSRLDAAPASPGRLATHMSTRSGQF